MRREGLHKYRIYIVIVFPQLLKWCIVQCLPIKKYPFLFGTASLNHKTLCTLYNALYFWWFNWKEIE